MMNSIMDKKTYRLVEVEEEDEKPGIFSEMASMLGETVVNVGRNAAGDDDIE